MSKPWGITFEITDAKGKKGTTTLHYPANATLEQVEAFTQAVLVALQATEGLPLGGGALLRGHLTGVTLHRDFPTPAGIRTIPYTTADVNEAMKLTWKAADGARTTIAIPAWNDHRTQVGGTAKKPKRIADVDLPGVVRLLTLFTGAASQFCSHDLVDNRGRTLTGYQGAAMKWKAGT